MLKDTTILKLLLEHVRGERQSSSRDSKRDTIVDALHITRREQKMAAVAILEQELKLYMIV